ncbi:MAG: hypothetical protein A2Y94_09950 [Caldithrix sp. RBG_13_44_9]|nr:MAG: hypothetical protein A2Y94_09950 [Caldithrix sp. RBG_13_44_9]
MKLQVVNPLETADWDHTVLSFKNYSFFHSQAWGRILSESYGYKPSYFCWTVNDLYHQIAAVMEINSFITGRRGVSLPFTDECEPLVHQVSENHFFKDLIEYGQLSSWKTLELRGLTFTPENIPSSEIYLGHTLTLNPGVEFLYSGFRNTTKNNIKKALRKKLQIIFSNSYDSLKIFYRLNCLTRKRHGLPPQPFQFFHNLYKHIIHQEKGFIVLASYKEKIVAGIIVVHFGRRAILKYNASDYVYKNLNANYLLVWEIIQHYVKNGFESLNFGRTNIHVPGLKEFKIGWGSKEYMIKYYKYNFRDKAFISAQNKEFGFHNAIFRKLNLSLLKWIGEKLYKHVG